MAIPPAVLAGRVFRLAVVGTLAVVLGAVAAFVVSAEEQCDAEGGGGPHCAHLSVPDLPPQAAQLAAAPGSSGGNSAAISADADARGSGGGGSFGEEPEAGPVHQAPRVGPLRLAIVLGLLIFVLMWLVMTVKFAVDGSLPARLALWGFLPEAYAAISVSAVCALLRLKTHSSTPVVVLRNCVTDANAVDLAEAFRLYGNKEKADLQAIELPYNPRLGLKGLEVIVDASLHKESQVAELDFSYNDQLGDGAIAVLRPVLEVKSSKIQVLKLADCGITQAGARQLAELVARSKLRTLDLSWNPLGGCGEVIGSIGERAAILEELVLAGCDLTAEDVGAVAEQLPYTSIRSLQLGGNRFGSKGLEALSQHLADSQVDELWLEGNDIEAGCPGLSALAQSWVQRPFSRLRLHGNRMTNAEVVSYIKTLQSLQG